MRIIQTKEIKRFSKPFFGKIDSRKSILLNCILNLHAPFETTNYNISTNFEFITKSNQNLNESKAYNISAQEMLEMKRMKAIKDY